MAYNPEKHNRRSIRLKDYDYSQPGFYYVTICAQDRIERFGIVEKDKMILNEAGEMVDAEWNRIPERYGQVVLDQYQIMPNHMQGILQIGSVGTGLVPVLNEQDKSLKSGHRHAYEPNTPVLNDGDETLGNDPIDGDKIRATTSEKDIAASGRMGIKPIPTPLYDMTGTFKSLTQNEYADHVRNDGWPPFRKRLWQLRFHDHNIRNETELNRIRRYIMDNPKNWAEDENNPENIKEPDETDS